MPIFSIFQTLGGLALFLFGMNVMSDGLRRAAGAQLRRTLTVATKGKFSGVSLGTLLGFLIHSSAASVMMVGFVNAGLMTMPQTIAPIMGANVGTTLSMQVLALDLDQYSYLAIALGLLVMLAGKSPRLKEGGRALLGFGLIFLGMLTMSAAVAPHREALAPLLTSMEGLTVRGLLAGTLSAAVFTGIIQSSGATIGMSYALIDAGIFTELHQVYPIVLGAHLGTCVTAMLGSIGTHVDARRTALAHVLFNFFNVGIGLLAAPVLITLLAGTSPDLTRQVANTHTFIMVLAAIVALPAAGPIASLLRRMLPAPQGIPPSSFLDERWIDRPEKALTAIISELQRVLTMAVDGMRLTGDILIDFDRRKVQQVRLMEKNINEIKASAVDYIDRLTRRYFSRRQMILLQHLDRCIAEAERIGDHIDAICATAQQQQNSPTARFDEDSMRDLCRLHRDAMELVEQLQRSLDPEQAQFRPIAGDILTGCGRYLDQSMELRNAFAERLADHLVTASAAVFYAKQHNAIDRIVRHVKTIATAESHPDFWIKQRKLQRRAGPDSEPRPPPPVDRQALIERLYRQEKREGSHDEGIPPGK